MKKLMLFTGLLAFLLFSCDEPPIEDPTFWAQDLRDGKFYGVDAELLYEGARCNVWGEKGSASKNDAQKVANKYDNDIYQNMMNNFGFTGAGIKDDTGKIVANTTMELADYFGDGDGKLCILLLDIKDDYSSSNPAYTAGYFWSGDLMQKNPNHSQLKYSNEKDMIFVDTNPGLKNNAENTYATLAHEMQHMMSYVTGIAVDRNDLDLWVDEGLSSAAEWVYFGNHTSNGRVSSYKANSSGLINKGNNFFVWGNRTNENRNAVLDDYSTVYLFFQWLRIQTSSSIYTDIIQSSNNDYRAVTASFNTRIGGGYSDWPTLLQTWLAANRINTSSGIYGYKGNIDIKAPYAPAAASIQLYPGEGVYSKTNSAPSTTPSTNIQYTYLTSSGTGGYSTGADLLTFNKNTIAGGGAETGTTTGIAASVNEVPEGRYIQPPSYELIRLDAGDMLRRNGNRNWNVSGYPRSNIAGRVQINED